MASVGSNPSLPTMNTSDRKLTGRIGLSMAINFFTIRGCTVCLPINDTQWYDLIIEKNGKFRTVQCKATATEDGTIDFRCTGGTDGGVYDNALDHPIDILFCVNKDLQIWVIPCKDLKEANVTRSIRLRTEPTTNGQGFQTYLYHRDLS